MIIGSFVAIAMGLLFGLGARRIEACSAGLHRRHPHLLPLRSGRSHEIRANVVVFRFFGGLFVVAGLIMLLFGHSVG